MVSWIIRHSALKSVNFEIDFWLVQKIANSTFCNWFCDFLFLYEPKNKPRNCVAIFTIFVKNKIKAIKCLFRVSNSIASNVSIPLPLRFQRIFFSKVNIFETYLREYLLLWEALTLCRSCSIFVTWRIRQKTYFFVSSIIDIRILLANLFISKDLWIYRQGNVSFIFLARCVSACFSIVNMLIKSVDLVDFENAFLRF